MKYYLAIDIGASGGRHIVGSEQNNKIQPDEVYRFPNGIKHTSDGAVWDIASLKAYLTKSSRCSKPC